MRHLVLRHSFGLLCACSLVLPAFGQGAQPLRPKPRSLAVVQAAPKADVAKPMPRPAILAPPPVVTAPSNTVLRPLMRPKSLSLAVQPAANPANGQTAGLARSPRPVPRPIALEQAAAAMPQLPERAQNQGTAAQPNLLQLLFGAGGAGKVPKGTAQAAPDLASAAPAPSAPRSTVPRKGSVCGDRSIRGEVIGAITSKVKGCGVADAVRVTEISGIRLSQAVTVECGTVQALKDWIDQAMRPAFGQRDVVQLRIAAHYVCRGRNNKRNARISEHGKGRALDISGFVFADGTEWSIKRDYNKYIRRAHQGACGIFGTTLGPGSDGYHEDHLHFDTAFYRNGPYCR